MKEKQLLTQWEGWKWISHYSSVQLTETRTHTHTKEALLIARCRQHFYSLHTFSWVHGWINTNVFHFISSRWTMTTNHKERKEEQWGGEVWGKNKREKQERKQSQWKSQDGMEMWGEQESNKSWRCKGEESFQVDVEVARMQIGLLCNVQWNRSIVHGCVHSHPQCQDQLILSICCKLVVFCQSRMDLKSERSDRTLNVIPNSSSE